MRNLRLVAWAIACFFALDVLAQQPDWQIHSLWCTTDPGSSGRNYKNACTQQNQYNSILSCQSHNAGASRESVRQTLDGPKQF
jgi:hypothetical protein